jgi:hypothetical protein
VGREQIRHELSLKELEYRKQGGDGISGHGISVGVWELLGADPKASWDIQLEASCQQGWIIRKKTL